MSATPLHETAADIMSARPLTVLPETPLSDAAGLLRESRDRHLTVVNDGGEVVGVVREDALASFPAGARVSDVMSQTAMTISSHTPSYEAVRLMLDGSTDYLPVVNSGRLAGVITRAHVLHTFRHG
jgi:CBS domain-containing protein